jgi:hypothetical protein
MGAAGRRAVEEHFSRRQQALALEATFREVAGVGGAR